MKPTLLAQHLVALGFIAVPIAVDAATIVVPEGRTLAVEPSSPLNDYNLKAGAKLNVRPGAATQHILANGAKVNINNAEVSAQGKNGIALYNSHAVIDSSRIVATLDPARPVEQAFGIRLSGFQEASSAFISNSFVSGIARGINAANSALVDLTNTEVHGVAGTPGVDRLPGGVGVVVAGASVRIRENSRIIGDNNGVVTFGGARGPGDHNAHLLIDNSTVEGREGSAIRVYTPPLVDTQVNIHVANGSRLVGGNGIILEVQDDAKVDFSVSDSRLTGDIVASEDATVDLTLADNASLTGTISNASSLNIDGSSLWTLTGDSNLDRLNLDQGTVSLRGEPANAGFTRLQLGELSGSGTFMLGADLTTGQGDFVDVSGKASGDHRLLVENTGTDPNAAVSAHHVVHTGEGSSSRFDLVGGQVDFGTYAYDLEQRGDDWFLVRKSNTTTPGTRSVTGLFSAAPTVWYGESSTLRTRMGELRNGQDQGGGWLRSYGNKHKVSAGAGAAYDQTQQGIAFGADMPIASSDGQWLIGLMGGYSRSNLDLSGGTSGKVDSFHVGAYSTWLADDGLYIDALIKANRFQNSSDVRMSDGRKAKGDYSNNGVGATVEVGKHFKLKDGWFVEPYTQLSTLWIDGADYTLDNGMRANANSASSVLGKVGSHVGRNFPLKDGGFVQPYVKVAAAHEFARDNQVRVNGNKFANDLSGSRIELGTGISAQVSDTLQVQAGFDYMKGKHIEQPWGVSVGVRYNW
ncbi:autotransporter outer membrane beta-barrel domain-containing protein [Pseudomonas parafulva]|uniref:Autotransporter outer membrane beta-barrel domain-containing protein n=1 Tax=Pseudomonas parafulva TaxID=157782 RepID=A0AAI8P8U2_9PSED|nr:autotransporter outer membrane beta-barrel domain-containing protein [Pseudomonas parafulva]AXO87118.1 autotransporter outer membrane beta-barrel domain-containing protein [Pseudomonas parafulva]